MRILVVEDEAKVASFVKRALEEEGYAVDSCADGAEGLERSRGGSYDLILLDVMLPARSGVEVVKELRQQKITTPVLLLTAQARTEQKVTGLDAGADDYLTKPFAIEELLARVRALLRRS
ncbi:MAG: response regulator, partial [Nitrospira sp.]